MFDISEVKDKTDIVIISSFNDKIVNNNIRNKPSRYIECKNCLNVMVAIKGGGGLRCSDYYCNTKKYGNRWSR